MSNILNIFVYFLFLPFDMVQNKHCLSLTRFLSAVNCHKLQIMDELLNSTQSADILGL